MKKQFLICAALVTLFACHKKDDPVTTTPVNVDPQLKVSFEHVVNNQPLVLKTAKYTNAHGDTFSVSTYKYYISNVSVYTNDGTEYKEPESYHLIDEAKSDSKSFVLTNLPKATYVKIKFLLGVDSTRNVSGAQTGALDPLNTMFWTWNTGYIMARMEGTSPQTNPYPDNLGFHIGRFKGTNNVLKWITLEFPSNAVITDTHAPGVHIKSDIAEWFKTPNVIDFAKLSVVAAEGANAKLIADNYADMFTVDHID